MWDWGVGCELMSFLILFLLLGVYLGVVWEDSGVLLEIVKIWIKSWVNLEYGMNKEKCGV